MRLPTAITLLTAAACSVVALTAPQAAVIIDSEDITETDSLDHYYIIVDGDTIFRSFLPEIEAVHTGPLTDADYEEIARDLGIETEVIKAVVEVETGRTRSGFHNDGRPLVNFDLTLFSNRAARHGVNMAAARREHPEVFARPDVRLHGSHQAAQHARLEGAMAIDSVAAVDATFWGMFQIGGFNYKLAGTESRSEFIRKVSRSEYDQLRMFANFIRNTGMLKHLRTRNWAAFAKMYNGPGYASRGYHTKMAAAYRRLKQRARQ